MAHLTNGEFKRTSALVAGCVALLIAGGTVPDLQGRQQPAAVPGDYQIVARHSGKCLDVSGASTSDGAVVLQWECHDGFNQQWSVGAVAGGYYRVIARHSGKALDVSGALVADAAPVIQSTPNPGTSQQWVLEPISGGYFRLIARHSGKALDVNAASNADGAPVIQYTPHGGANQQWLLRPLSPPGPGAPANTPPIGINMSEAEYSWGSFPGANDLAYLKSNRINLVRVPIAWERAQPSLGAPLDAEYVGALKAFIAAAGAEGMRVIVDVHNYGRYNRSWAQDAAANYGYVAVGNGDIIGSAAVPIASFTDFWKKLATTLRGTAGLAYYGIMNEPHDMGGVGVWPAIAQAAVTAIRSVDMTTSILVAGTQWGSARWWPWDNGTLHINDPANNVLYEAHLYFDRDGGGRYPESYEQSGAYPDIGVDTLRPFLDWLTRNQVKGFLGEFGIPNDDPRWLVVLDRFLTALQGAGLSGTYWNYTFRSVTDPPWWPVNDPMSIRLDNGQTNPQMDILSNHNEAR